LPLALVAALGTSSSRPSFPDALALAPALARTIARAGRRPRDVLLAPNAPARADADALAPVVVDIPSPSVDARAARARPASPPVASGSRSEASSKTMIIVHAHTARLCHPSGGW
jgi:hypothetical protein